jgi:hypothetical protein
MTPATRRAVEFERSNAIAARAILENPERFGGESAGVVRWARRILLGRETSTAPAANAPEATGTSGGQVQAGLDFEGVKQHEG